MKECKHEGIIGQSMMLGDYCYDCKKFISGIIIEEDLTNSQE